MGIPVIKFRIRDFNRKKGVYLIDFALE